MPKSNKTDDLQQRIDELTEDLQRTRADFENYRKRTEQDKTRARAAASAATVLKLLPIVDNLDRALAHLPEHLVNDSWAHSVINLRKHLDKSLENLQVKRIAAQAGQEFNPEFHEAIQMDDGDGDKEVISEELQAGYMRDGQVIRHSMVKVTREK